MSKGCGCQTGIFKWLKPPYAEKFHAACVMHDDDYDRGGSAQDRKEYDTALYWHILTIASKEHPSALKMKWFTFIAFIYYISVRIFGKFYFNYRK